MSRPDDLDLELLEADVRASAPRMSPELVVRLEEIMVQPPRRRMPRRWQLAPAAGIVTALVAVAVFLVSRPGDQVASESFSSGSSSAGSSGGGAVATPAPPSSARAAQDVGAISVPRRRRVERDAALTLATPSRSFDDVADRVVATTDRFRGIVQRSAIDQEGRSGRAEFDLRLPSSRLEQALAALSRLAHVRSRSAGSVDVTGAFNASAARLEELQAERRALLRALARASTQAEVSSVKARLRDVGRRLARTRRTVARLRARTDLARVHLTVVATRERPAAGGGGGDGRWTPGDAARDALRVLEVAMGGVLVALAVLLPVALFGGALVAGTRTARRRRRDAALSA